MGCDLFKPLKDRIMTNITTLVGDLKANYVAPKKAMDLKEVLTSISTGSSKITMPGMYNNYLRNRTVKELSSLLDGDFECMFLDIIVYMAALQYYKGKTNVKEFSLFDFINLVSPVKVTKL